MVPLILFVILSVTLGDELPDHILKCCRYGEELHSNGRDCVRKAGFNSLIMDEDVYVDVGYPIHLKLQTLYWLPTTVLTKLPNQTLFVGYRNTEICDEEFVLLNTNYTDRYTITDNYNLSVSFSYIDGDEYIVEFVNIKYCLDSISGSRGPHVFRMCLDSVDNVTAIKKCCNFGQRIQLRNNILTCEDGENSTWSIQDSIFNIYFPNTTITDVLDGGKFLCSSGEFKIIQPKHANNYITGSFKLFLNDFELKNYECYDSFIDEFTENETIGYCYHANKTLKAYYLVFRHFGVVAAIVLAVGLTILASRSDITKTVHGKALLCHILSLCIGHVVYAMWEYEIQNWDDNTLILLALNFCMMSSVLWLNVICFNMARGLRTPLEACKNRNRWVAFAWYSLYVWGSALLHTVLLATQPWKEYDNRNIISYVYHTKTFFYPDEWRNSLNLDVLFFGYGPSCILLIINVCFLTETILKIRKLERNTSLLHRRLSVCITNRKKSLKYVRLLLTAGVGETAAEMAALTMRFPPTYADDGSRLMGDEIWFMGLVYTEFLFRTLAALIDLLRAVSVLVLCCSKDSGVVRWVRSRLRAIRRIVITLFGKRASDDETNTYTVNP